MPNLFYNMSLTRIFDLKGSLRNRYIKPKKPLDVLLDRNLLEQLRGFSFPLTQPSQRLLDKCVSNDTLFLAGKELVDYSALVGVDDVNRKLIIGIIDYIGRYV